MTLYYLQWLHLPVVSPGADHNVALLGVKGEEGDVHVAGRGEDPSGLPVDASSVGHQHAHPVKILRHMLCPEQRKSVDGFETTWHTSMVLF